MLRIPYEKLAASLTAVFVHKGFSEERARTCARLFAETTRDGMYSHGVNRLSRFIQMIDLGRIVVHAAPVRVSASGAVERWDGRLGPGNLNALESMDGAMELARRNGIGCVALGNTTHWMCGGTYGRQAAGNGFIGICWSNTLANLPPWGSKECRLGNNPLILSVPRSHGDVVLDFAMSQFSFGSLEAYRRAGLQLPVAGGYDAAGKLTTEPAAIEESARPVPIGFWKGSGLSLMLDLIATLLSGGRPTRDIPADPLREVGLSQIFIAIDPLLFQGRETANELADYVVDYVKGAEPVVEGGEVLYPGERVVRIRKENMEMGIPVEADVWEKIQEWSRDREGVRAVE